MRVVRRREGKPLRRSAGIAFLLVVALAQSAFADADLASITQAVSLPVPERLRLLVVAPHPDDETLGAAGLMQRVQELHGRVSVAYVTSGDGYLDGVELETGKLKPKPRDFVDYGEQRLHEALRALQAISISQKSLFVFGFPDGGLLDLLTTYWSSKHGFVSPYTRDSRPPYPRSLDPDTAYSGVALERELARLITHVSPQWIAVTGPWDIHPDHCATFHFVVRALRRLTSSNPRFAVPRVLAYTVHRPDWPGFSEGTTLGPPPGIASGNAIWRFLDLTTAELDGKGRALDEYTSQMDIMAVLFRGFVRPNEVFAVYSSLPVEPPDACGRPLPVPVEPAPKSR
jgi:LmbE family N-acetylglucosaminyl deacetylase